MQKCTNVSHAWFGQCLASKCTPLHIYDIYLCQSNHTSKTCSSLYSSGRLWLLLHLHPVIQDMLVIIDPVIIRKIAAHHEASGQLWWRDLIGWDMSRQLRNCADIKGAVRVGRRQDGQYRYCVIIMMHLAGVFTLCMSTSVCVSCQRRPERS